MSGLKTIKSWAASQARRGNTAKGNAFEARIEAHLLKKGYIVERTVMNRRMIYRKGRAAWITRKADFFGCIDIIAFKPGEDTTLFIQATTDRGEVQRKIKEIDQVFFLCAPSRTVEVWTLGPNNEPRIFRQRDSDWLEIYGAWA